MIDTTIAPPLGAIALQWFSKTPYMTNIPVMDGIGGLLVTRKFYESLPTDLQKLLLQTGEEAGRQLLLETRRDNEKSLKVLKDQGVTFTNEWKDSDAVLYDLRDRAAASLAKDGYIPDKLYTRTRQELENYRARAGKK